MSKFKVTMQDVYTGELIDEEEELFDTEQDARDYADEWGTNFSTGAEILKNMGREYTPREDVDIVIDEIDDEDE